MGEIDLHAISKRLQKILPLLTVLIAVVKAEIRCYCNQPSCVSTNYMCKSSSDACFTELFSYSNDLSKSRHGCVELLSAKKRSQCRPLTTEVSSLPALLCCREDMCNYINAMEINIQVHMPNRSLNSDSNDFMKERHAYEAALQQDIWFKAAVIAVPIAGGFILVLLILLATRMLRQDSKRQRQLLEMRHQQQQRLCAKSHYLLPCVGTSSKVSRHYDDACLVNHNWYANVIAPTDRAHYVFDKVPSDNIDPMKTTLLPWPGVHRSKPFSNV